MDMRWRGPVTQPQSAGNPTGVSRSRTPIQRLLPMLLKPCVWAIEQFVKSLRYNAERSLLTCGSSYDTVSGR